MATEPDTERLAPTASGAAVSPSEPLAALEPVPEASAVRGDVQAARATLAWAARHAAAAVAGRGVADLRIDDPRLGRVGLRLRVAGGRVRVTIRSGAAEARALLLAERAGLAADLARRGLHLDSLTEV